MTSKHGSTISMHANVSPGLFFFFTPMHIFPRTENSARISTLPDIKGCGMGPWLVLVSPGFRENVVAPCKIGSFLCSLDNLLQKNVNVFIFGN